MKIALTGDTALELFATYFSDAGYEVMPADARMEEFAPEVVYDVTARERVLAGEVDGFYDERMRRLAGCRFSRAGIAATVDEFAWQVASAPKKVLAVDADNTLWRGILSEDGPDALVACDVFQSGLRSLREDGVVLVLLSKNDPFEIDWFASCKVNWAPKAGNLLEACRELNLSPDAVVFVDDNPHERLQMKAHLPEVTVAPWGGWRSEASNAEARAREERQLVRRLREYFFSGTGRTEEDRLRAHDYEAARLRAKLSFASRDEYLDDLGLWVRPGVAATGDLDRLAQMAGKTNQFNATTLRRTRDEFARLLAASAEDASAPRVFVFRAGDRFGEQGLVCYVVAEPRTRRITDFVMSCRAMGRTLEHFALGFVEASLGGPCEIDFVPTAKNRPFADFLASRGKGTRTHYRVGDAASDGDKAPPKAFGV